MDRSHRGMAIVLAGSLALAAAVALTGCSGGGSASVEGGSSGSSVNEMGYQVHAMHMADPGTVLPRFANTTPEVSALYTFADQHPEVLSYIPCTCGCGPMGHMSNWNCYVRGSMRTGS